MQSIDICSPYAIQSGQCRDSRLVLLDYSMAIFRCLYILSCTILVRLYWWNSVYDMKHSMRRWNTTKLVNTTWERHDKVYDITCKTNRCPTVIVTGNGESVPSMTIIYARDVAAPSIFNALRHRRHFTALMCDAVRTPWISSKNVLKVGHENHARKSHGWSCDHVIMWGDLPFDKRGDSVAHRMAWLVARRRNCSGDRRMCRCTRPRRICLLLPEPRYVGDVDSTLFYTDASEHISMIYDHSAVIRLQLEHQSMVHVRRNY